MKRWSVTAMAGAMAACAALAMPSVGNALSTGFDSRPVSLKLRGFIGSFTPASVDPRLARELRFTALSGAPAFRFTPAATPGETQRSVTVAVRLPSERARIVSVRPAVLPTPAAGSAPARIGSIAYNLGTAKGWQKFALPEVREIAMPDLGRIGSERATFAGEARKPSRFSGRIELDAPVAAGNGAIASRAPDATPEYTLDVAGSYRIMRNLDVTAGIRYSREQDRLAPLTDDRADAQAVYVGTQFRF